MADRAPSSAPRRIPWRPWLRALHRDFGYVVVGLTFVYALSGLAVNHIAEWDPNHEERETVHELGRSLPEDDREAAEMALAAFDCRAGIDAVDAIGDEELEIRAGDVTIVANRVTGSLLARERRPRWLLRTANWLHLNRGKKAWTAIADAYAVLLLFLATSGLFMIPGRKGLVGRGGILLLVGIAVPVLYVVFSGGP